MSRRRSPDLADAALDVVRPARRFVERGARALGRELSEPWRTGPEGPAAEAGRWIGAGLAVGAFVLGVAAALRATRRG